MFKRLVDSIIYKQAEKFASRKFILFCISLLTFLLALIYCIRHNSSSVGELIWGVIAILGAYAGSDVVEKKAVDAITAFKSKEKKR